MICSLIFNMISYTLRKTYVLPQGQSKRTIQRNMVGCAIKDTKGVIRIRKSKDRQHSGQKKRTNNNTQKTEDLEIRNTH